MRVLNGVNTRGRERGFIPFGGSRQQPLTVVATKISGWGPFTSFKNIECNACSLSTWRPTSPTSKSVGTVTIELAVDDIDASWPGWQGFPDCKVTLPRDATVLRALAEELISIADEAERG